MKIGSHVNNNGDLMLYGAAKEAIGYNANCFMLYLGAPQNSYRKDISLFKINEMKEILKENNINIDDIIVHAPYIVNLAQPNEEKREYAINFIINEIKMMETIGFKTIVIHPGAHMNNGIENGVILISDSIKRIINSTNNVCIAIETMAGKGSECCSKFDEIMHIIDNVNNDRLKVCLDTCHIFDSGYDIVNNYDDVVNEFIEKISLEKLAVIHLNDSLNTLGSHKDRHANIGFGNIGFDTLYKFFNDSRFIDIPKILETPYVNEKKEFPPYKYEIEMLKSGAFDENLIKRIIQNNKK